VTRALPFDTIAVMGRKIRLAWISTFNSRCGLAMHSEHLLEHFDRAIYDIVVVADRVEPLTPDPPFVERLWPDAGGSLAGVRDLIGGFDAVFVNFHPAQIRMDELAETLRMARLADIDTYVNLHKTLDTVIDGHVASLRDIAAALRGATRLIVHTAADVARLAELEVADNVALIPPGVIDQPAFDRAQVRTLLDVERSNPIIGSFGFLLPHKGLPQLIEAFALVLGQFPDAMLLMLNAQYPAPESAEEREICRDIVGELRLDARVKLVDAFLATDEILLLLGACDLTVFPYQSSDESASAAVRLGLAAGRPVATTPLPIFAGLEGVVHPLAGIGPADIAAGILALLRDPDRTAALSTRQRDWIRSHSWATQAGRIDAIIRDGFAGRHGSEAAAPVTPRREAGAHDAAPADPAVLLALAERAVAALAAAPQPPLAGFPAPRPHTGRGPVEWLPVLQAGPVGQRTAAGISSEGGEAGHLFYGPYARLGAGEYRVRIRWRGGQPEARLPPDTVLATIEAVSGDAVPGHATYLAQRDLTVRERGRGEHDLRFRIEATDMPPWQAVEVRFWTSGLVPLTVSSVTVERFVLPPPA
jgi:glycosyltransferase involved in cell wall biosynthesis